MIVTSFVSLGCNIFNLVALGELDGLLACCKSKKKEEDKVAERNNE